MIELTVRTLDSQNHPFLVEDDITVAQFKQHIAETVNIPAETQRIIYCGRVLTDESKLSEFDVNGKVVHLVERAPPTESQRGNGNRSVSPGPPPVRRFGSNAMYLGSMAIPLEPQNLVPPPPSHSLAASRLNVARRMLRRAEAVINLLENPSARPTDTTPAEEPQEEVTPVFEARVIVPTVPTEPIDEAFVLNAVQNSLINATTNIPGGSTTVQQPAETTTNIPDLSNSQSTVDVESPPRSVSSTPEGVSPISTSTEDLASEARTGAATERNGLAENASRTTEMADLLETLGRLQTRFAPFLERYQNFMREDPAVAQEDIRRTQAMMNRVSEVLHFFGHAYHSLSDIIIRVRNAPPRPLLCRPILLQHSAVLQAGFPIQVEAQINFTPETASTPSAPSTTNSNATTTSTTTESSTATTATPNQTSTNTTTTSRAFNYASQSPHILGIPLLPPSGVHVQSFPIGIRTLRAGTGNRAPAPNTTNSNTSQPAGQTGNTTQNTPPSFNNPNLEFFMDVTPDSITIDSLETNFLGLPSEGGIRAPPPELIQSIVQMANHLVNRGAAASNVAPPTTTQPQQTSQTETTTQSASNNTNTGQNSQARGNTQTNPTTATYTRSTARPHVHLAQHAMQGFDPFLPCNSHHVNTRRRAPPRTQNTNNNQATNNNSRAQNGNTNPNQFNPVYNIVQGVLNSLQNLYGRRNVPQGQTAPPTTAAPSTTASSSSAPVSVDINQLFANMPNFANILPHIQNLSSTDQNARTPTIAQLLQQGGDQTDGEGIFNDLTMLLSRNFTIGDMLQLNGGRLDPLMRIRNELRNFITDRILDGPPTPDNVERGVYRLLAEMQPFLENLVHLQVRDDIDIVRSTQMLFRSRLPNILNLAVSRTPNSIKMLVDQLRITSSHLFALILHSSSTGQRGVEEVLGMILTRYMEGIAPDVQQWTILAQLQQFMRSLNVPTSALQPYIVRNVDSVTTTRETEPMELEAQAAADNEWEQAGGSTSVLGVINLNDTSEPLPTVVLGSEPWHGQVPTDWVPIITKDTQRQRRQNQQSPLSDAYLSGMPSKRRKIVTNGKPQGSLPQVIAESIRRAVTSTGLSQVGNLDAVAQEAGADLNIQSAYRDLLRTRVQSSIQDNEDFTPDRFPNASNYFSKSQ